MKVVHQDPGGNGDDRELEENGNGLYGNQDFDDIDSDEGFWSVLVF